MILLIPANGFITTRIKKLQQRKMKLQDERVKQVNEVCESRRVLIVSGTSVSWGPTKRYKYSMRNAVDNN